MLKVPALLNVPPMVKECAAVKAPTTMEPVPIVLTPCVTLMVCGVVLLPMVSVLLLFTDIEFTVNAPAGIFTFMFTAITTSSTGNGTCPSDQFPGLTQEAPVDVLV